MRLFRVFGARCMKFHVLDAQRLLLFCTCVPPGRMCACSRPPCRVPAWASESRKDRVARRALDCTGRARRGRRRAAGARTASRSMPQSVGHGFVAL